MNTFRAAAAIVAALSIAVVDHFSSRCLAAPSQVLEVLARDSALREPSQILGQRGGVVYGICLNGLSLAVFGYKPSGEVFSFATLPPNETFVSAALAVNGAVYVSTANNVSAKGSIFRMDPAGSLRQLLEFTDQSGAAPGSFGSELVAGSGDDIYGITTTGGAYANGVIFHAPADGSYEIRHIFSGGLTGGAPNLLRRDSDGTLYGTCKSGGAFSGGTAFKLTSDGTFATLANLPASATGAPSCSPADLIIDSNHNLFGVTLFGGPADKGIAFKITPAGAYSFLATFPNSTTGVPATRTLMLASDGNLYGTTGKAYDLYNLTPGDVFRITPGGVLTPLFTFTGAGGDAPGFDPAKLVEAAGALYGVTRGYGLPSLSEGAIIPDTIYRLSEPSTYTTLAVLRPPGEFNITVNALGQLVAPDPVQGATGTPLLLGFTAKGGADGFGSSLQIHADGSVDESTVFRAGKLPVNGMRSITDGSLFDVKLVETHRAALIRYGLGKLPETLATFEMNNQPVLLRPLSDGSILFHDVVARDQVTGEGLAPYRLMRATPEGEVTTVVELPAASSSLYLVRRNIERVAELPEGDLFCAERAGGVDEEGALLIVSRDGSVQRPVIFTGSAGSYPGRYPTDLVEGDGGWFYGATLQGGAADAGVVFRYHPHVGFQSIQAFTGSAGPLPYASPGRLVRGNDGFIYGVCYDSATGRHARLWRTNGTGVQLLGSDSDFGPDDVVEDILPLSGGGCIGASFSANTSATYSGGIFRVGPDGGVVSLVDFTRQPLGAIPHLSVAGEDGRFYGTVSSNNLTQINQGLLFSIDESGDFETIYQFDGVLPLPNLVGPDGDGIIYGNVGNILGIDPALYRLNEVRKPRLRDSRVAGVSPSTAVLAASVTPLDGPTVAWFEYGPTSGLEQQTPIQQLDRSESPTSISATLPGLTYGATYYFQAVARNAAGERRGPVLTVVPASNAPRVRDDLVLALRGYQVQIDVLANDTEPDAGDTFSIESISESVQGRQPILSSSGRRVAYDAPENFTGSDSFTYTVVDSYGIRATATVRVFSVATLAGTLVGRVTGGSFDPSSNGQLQLKLSALGSLTCVLQWPGVTGQTTINRITDERVQLALPKRIRGEVVGQVVLTLNLDPAGNRITGTVQDGSLTATFDVLAGDEDPAAERPAAGLYTSFFEPALGSAFTGLGGHLIVSAPKKGTRATFSGRLPDGTSFRTQADLHRGAYEIFTPLYRDSKGNGPGGFLRGKLNFSPPIDPEHPGEDVQLQGTLEWAKGSDSSPGAVYYVGGLGETLSVSARRHDLQTATDYPIWIEPTRSPNASVSRSAGGLQDQGIDGTIGRTGLFKPATTRTGYVLSFKNRQARFIGSFVDPVLGKRTFEGMIDSHLHEARAPFAGAASAGLVKVSPFIN